MGQCCKARPDRGWGGAGRRRASQKQSQWQTAFLKTRSLAEILGVPGTRPVGVRNPLTHGGTAEGEGFQNARGSPQSRWVIERRGFSAHWLAFRSIDFREMAFGCLGLIFGKVAQRGGPGRRGIGGLALGLGLLMSQEHQPSEALPHPLDTTLQLRRDTIFCQALVAAVCTFSEQLLAALSYRYNNNGEYEESSRDASRKWLEQVAATGVLLHCQSLLSPAVVVSEGTREQGPLGAWAGELLPLHSGAHSSSHSFSSY